MRLAFVLTIILAVFWYSLSGYTKPLLLLLGAISIAITVLTCWRMRILDEETVPYLYIPKTLSYYWWLVIEIGKANFQVVRAVLKPIYEISPKMIRVPAPQLTDNGRAMFANSITLTPGTVSVDMGEDKIVVHALLEEMAVPADFREMGERAAWSVGEAKPEPKKKTRAKKVRP